ncbi:MAG TPA: alpha/beta fold hydrolase [Gemmatimonadaceae bacterium]
MRMRLQHFVVSAVLLAPATAAAQQPSTFVMLMGKDTLAVERVTRTPNRLDGDFVSPARGVHLRYAGTLAADGTMSRFETWAYRGSDTVGTHATMELEGDSMTVALQGRTLHFATKAGAIAYFNPSMGLLEQAVMRARAVGGQSAEVPLFASEGAATVPLTVTWVGSDSAHLALGGVVMNVSVGTDGRLTGIAVPSQNVRVVRVEGASVSATIAKPDYSAPSDAPYTAEEVTVHTPAGLTLAGTLTLPKVRPSRGAPAIVTITGSGTEERDESIPGVNGYRPFRQIADTLGRRGIAVLRLDDRGAGGSDMGPKGPTSADFADDIRAALAYLRTRKDIDGTRLGLVGHSEGGMIAPMVAATDPKLRAIVLMAGPSHTGRAILKYQQEYAADSMLHLTGARRDSALRDMAQKLDSAAAAQPWVHFFLDYDPIATAKRVKQPVLIVQGATDKQVTPEQAVELASAFRAAGNGDVTMKPFPSTDHLFLADPVGNPSGYAALPSKNVRVEVLGTIADWLAAHMR